MKEEGKRKKAARRKSSVSKVGSYAEIGDFWDEHDLADFWAQTRPAHADVELESEQSLYAVEKGLSETIRLEAKQRGVSPHTLVNLWLQEKVQQLRPRSRQG